MPSYTIPQQSITTTAVQPYNGTVSGTPLQLARDYLASYTGDYVFFRFSENDYVLILPDSSADITFTDASVSVDGSFSVFEIEQVSGTSGNYGSTYSQLYYTPDIDNLFIYNPNRFIMYASDDNYPHLQEGSVYYGYAQTAVLCAVCVFLLIARVFKFVSRS